MFIYNNITTKAGWNMILIEMAEKKLLSQTDDQLKDLYSQRGIALPTMEKL